MQITCFIQKVPVFFYTKINYIFLEVRFSKFTTRRVELHKNATFLRGFGLCFFALVVDLKCVNLQKS